MNDYPENFIEFMDRFPTDLECRKYFLSVKYENGFICPTCGHSKYWTNDDSRYLICQSCRHRVSLLAGTVMQDSKLSVRVWLTSMWLFATQKDGISAKSLQENLGLGSYKSAWSLLHKLRIAMVRASRDKLSGIVEIDEEYIGGTLEGGKRGRGSENKQLVVIAVQLDEIQGENPSRSSLRSYRLSKIRAKQIPNASKQELHAFIKENITTGSKLIRDDWSGYQGIDGEGFHSEITKASMATTEDERLPHIHLAISLIKRWILGTYQGSFDESNLQTYLEEFTFRFNRKTAHNRGWLFHRMVQGAVATEPHPYESLLIH
jgi:transposase-like protein